MFDVEKYLDKLCAMDPSDVAAMVQEALDDAKVEYSSDEIGILFDGLFAFEEVPIRCSTSFAVVPAVLGVKGVRICNKFDASEYALAA